MSAAEVPALLIDHVTKTFVVGRHKRPVVAISDVSMRLERGEIYGVLGANGSGKSTLIRLVSTLLTIDPGRVEVFGHDIASDEMAVKRLHQPRQRRRGVLQEALTGREPALRRPPLRAGREVGQARLGQDPGSPRRRQVPPGPARSSR